MQAEEALKGLPCDSEGFPKLVPGNLMILQRTPQTDTDYSWQRTTRTNTEFLRPAVARCTGCHRHQTAVAKHRTGRLPLPGLSGAFPNRKTHKFSLHGHSCKKGKNSFEGGKVPLFGSKSCPFPPSKRCFSKNPVVRHFSQIRIFLTFHTQPSYCDIYRTSI